MGWALTAFVFSILCLPGAYAAGETFAIIHFPDELTLEALPAGRDRAKQSALLAAALKEQNARSIKKFRAQAESLGPGAIQEMTPLWLTNSVRVRAHPIYIARLRQLNNLSLFLTQGPREMFELPEGNATLRVTHDTPTIAWGVARVGAPALWRDGITGMGVVVAVIDSGANVTHPDLAPSLWKNAKETLNGVDDDRNGLVDDIHGWNFEDGTSDLTDERGHGSHAAAIVAGQGLRGLRTGVAPGAKVMTLKSCCTSEDTVFESHMWESIQYAMENGADVISMSLSMKHSTKPTYEKWRRIGKILLHAGILHINSAGNQGTDRTPFNVGAPGSNPPAWFHPDQTPGEASSMLTVGATDMDDQVKAKSSAGPVTWEGVLPFLDFPFAGGQSPGLIKPDICGPSDTPSISKTGTDYIASFGGTSAATPHLAGVAALLLQVRYDLTPAELTEAIAQSALPIDTPFNNRCGAGRADAAAAHAYLTKHF